MNSSRKSGIEALRQTLRDYQLVGNCAIVMPQECLDELFLVQLRRENDFPNLVEPGQKGDNVSPFIDGVKGKQDSVNC